MVLYGPVELKEAKASHVQILLGRIIRKQKSGYLSELQEYCEGEVGLYKIFSFGLGLHCAK